MRFVGKRLVLDDRDMRGIAQAVGQGRSTVRPWFEVAVEPGKDRLARRSGDPGFRPTGQRAEGEQRAEVLRDGQAVFEDFDIEPARTQGAERGTGSVTAHDELLLSPLRRGP